MATASFPLAAPIITSADSQTLAYSVVADLAAATPAAQTFSSAKSQPAANVMMAQASTKIQRFVQKLWNIVNSKSDLVGWSSDGSKVVVHRPKEFAKRILPLYFNTSNMSSFTRQLHFYGFKKTLSGKRSRPENWECQHEYFVRDQPEMLVRITRKRCNVQMASQEETVQLRKEVHELREVVARQQEQMQSMAAMLLALHGQVAHNADRKRKAGGQHARVKHDSHVQQTLPSPYVCTPDAVSNLNENQPVPPEPMNFGGEYSPTWDDDLRDFDDLFTTGSNYWS